jgi:aryl-alcohol dehydrogenase-like predicted oxidoreductase
MERRLLGNTAISVSEIAFGGVEIGVPYGIGVRDERDMLSQRDAVRLLHSAQDKGINLFDTARLYGDSESIMGRAFKGRRDQVVLATKCCHFLDENGRIPPYEALKKTILGSLEESLKALQTDYVDIYMLHQADHGILEDAGVKRVFNELKQTGRIRATGTSVYRVEETLYAIQDGGWDIIQIPFNLMDQRQLTAFESAAAAGVALVVRSVLLKGLLSSRGRNLHPALREVEMHIAKYAALFSPEISDLPTLAMKFALSFSQVSSVLVGIDREEYLEKTLRSADGVYLGRALLAKATALGYPDPAFLDLPKWDRMGWLT